MFHYDTGDIVLLVLTFLKNGGNYMAINFVGIFFPDKDLVIILVECQ